jgi:hypothetical protein
MKAGFVVLFFFLTVLLIPAGLSAAESYEELYPYLVDLPGWSAQNPEGADFRPAGVHMLGAEREYRKGDMWLKVSIAIGQQAAALWTPDLREGLNVKTPEGQVTVEWNNGYLVASEHKTADRSGKLIIRLLDPEEVGMQNGALLSFTYSGMDRPQVEEIARRFDWKAIQEKVRQFE